MAFKRWIALVVAGLIFPASGCGSGEDRPDQVSSSDSGGHGHDDEESGDPTPPAFDEADATSTLTVTMRDYAFVGLPSSTKGPNVLFKTTISGSNTHELAVVSADGDTIGEIPPFKGKETKHLAVELEPGAYVIQCLVKEGTKTHAQLGMRADLTVE